MTSTPTTPATYELDCPDPELATTVRRWLDESGLAWPGRFTIAARMVDALPENIDPREAYPESDVAIQAGPPDQSVHVRWTTAPAEAVIHPSEPQMDLQFTPEALAKFEGAERGFMLVALRFVLRRLGWYHVHGAALGDPAGRLPDEGTELAPRKKTAFTPEALGGRWTEVVVPTTLLFPMIGEQTAIEAMRPAKVLAELVV